METTEYFVLMLRYYDKHVSYIRASALLRPFPWLSHRYMRGIQERASGSLLHYFAPSLSNSSTSSYYTRAATFHPLTPTFW